jgi:transposase
MIKETRESRKARAELLSSQGLSYREIGERIGMTMSGVYKLFHPIDPEILKAENKRRNEDKREWERRVAGNCLDCGEPLSIPKSKRCRPCAQTHEEVESSLYEDEIYEYWQSGLPVSQIADKMGVPSSTISSAIYNARKRGRKEWTRRENPRPPKLAAALLKLKAAKECVSPREWEETAVRLQAESLRLHRGAYARHASLLLTMSHAFYWTEIGVPSEVGIVIDELTRLLGKHKISASEREQWIYLLLQSGWNLPYKNKKGDNSVHQGR